MYRVIGKYLIAATSAAMAVSVLGFSAPAYAKELVLSINGDKGHNGLRKVGERFEKATGVKVKVETPQDPPGTFQQAAASGKGPDIFCWAHDRLGEWQKSGLIAELKPSPKLQKAIEKKAWDAFTIDGKIYGYPYAFEAVGLIYNTDITKDAPKRFEDFFDLHKKLQKDDKSAILWDYKNTYFTWGLLGAQGAYPFKRNPNGSYDDKDVGVANAGAIAGLKMLVRLIEEGVMPRGAGYAEMEAQFNQGKLAAMITGPWAWENLRKSNIKFAVAPIPSVGGKPGTPFVGVQGCLINQASAQKDLAKEFLENYVLTDAGLKDVDNDKPIGVPALKSFYRVRSKDPLIKATMLNVKNGTLMPSTPSMGRFWSAMASALENATQGRQSPEEALKAAEKRIKN